MAGCVARQGLRGRVNALQCPANASAAHTLQADCRGWSFLQRQLFPSPVHMATTFHRQELGQLPAMCAGHVPAAVAVAARAVASGGPSAGPRNSTQRESALLQAIAIVATVLPEALEVSLLAPLEAAYTQVRCPTLRCCRTCPAGCACKQA